MPKNCPVCEIEIEYKADAAEKCADGSDYPFNEFCCNCSKDKGWTMYDQDGCSQCKSRSEMIHVDG